MSVPVAIAEDPRLVEIVQRLARVYDPEQIFLFGSRARGEGGPDSDYDILVIVPDDSPADRRTSRIGYQALRGTGTATDVVVWRRGVFEERARVRASLPCAVLEEGLVVYGG